MSRGLFDLTYLESMNDDDVIPLNFNEEYDGPKTTYKDYKKMSDEEKEEFGKSVKEHQKKKDNKDDKSYNGPKVKHAEYKNMSKEEKIVFVFFSLRIHNSLLIKQK